MEPSSHYLDFDQWRLLARSDPEAFESRRREVIDAAIARAPAKRQPRLRGLQWRIDLMRRRASTPLAACITLSDMMWQAFAGSNGLLERLHGRGREHLLSTSSSPMPDNVLPLSRKRHTPP